MLTDMENLLDVATEVYINTTIRSAIGRKEVQVPEYFLGLELNPATTSFFTVWGILLAICVPCGHLIQQHRKEQRQERRRLKEVVKATREASERRMAPASDTSDDGQDESPGCTKSHSPSSSDTDEGYAPRPEEPPARDTILAELIAAPKANRAFIGAQRCGKSGLIAVAGQRLAQQRNLRFFHINLASYTKPGLDEDALYTLHIKEEDSVRDDIAIIQDRDQVEELVEKAKALVHKWFKSENSILIVEEWFSLASKVIEFSDLIQPLAKLIAGKLAHLTSAGTKRGLAIWMVTPQIKADEMTETGKTIKQAKLCFVGISPRKSIDWNGEKITWDAELYQYVSKNFPITEPGGSEIIGETRIGFVNGRWLPLGTTQEDFDKMKEEAEQKKVGKDRQLFQELGNKVLEKLTEKGPMPIHEIKSSIHPLNRLDRSKTFAILEYLKSKGEIIEIEFEGSTRWEIAGT